EILEESSRGKKCEGMEGLIKEGNEAIQEEEEDLLCDIAMISAAQRVEHYEIAAYNAVIRHCEHLNLDDVRELLEQNLQEEEAADEKLGSICEELCTRAASMGSEEDVEEEEEEEQRPAARAQGRKTARARS